jgi:hypothetical protein
MQISALPTKFPVVWGASANPSYIRNVPTASQIGIVNGAASLVDGFPPLNFLPVGSGGVPPFGQDMNGILRQITEWSQWQNAGGLVQYDSAFSTAIGGYPFGALLAGTTAGVVWLSTVDNNTSNPDTGGAHWTNIGASSSPIMVGLDTGSANVVTANVLPAPSAYADGQLYIIQKVATPNNGSMTGNIQTLGSHPIVNMDGTALTPNQWPASGTGMLEYNLATTSFRLLNPVATVAANSGLATTAQQVLSLNISSLLAPTGALSLTDTIAQHVGSDGVDRKVPLSQVASLIHSAALVNVRVFTLSGTYTPTSGANNMLAFATGGGGAGGNIVGGGGCAGGTALYFGPVGSQVVTIGAGGVPNASFGSLLPGGSGGTTSFGSLAVATGGGGGYSSGSGISNGAGGQSVGVGTAGTLLMPGCGGSPGSGEDGGCGGSSFWGGGGFGGANQVGSGPGVAGGPGSLGGGGGGADGGTPNAQGGAGGAGVVVVFEFS